MQILTINFPHANSAELKGGFTIEQDKDSHDRLMLTFSDTPTITL